MLKIPFLFMDSIGTVLSAVILGPVYGAIVGILTNVILSFSLSYSHLYFAIINAVIGLVVGFIAYKFGFNFMYRNTNFRCCVSFDDDNEDPYWGIKGLTEDIYSRPKIFEALQKMVIQSNKGFHNCEYNEKEWVVSDYEKKELIVDKFISLAHLICGSESCAVE